MSDSYTPFEPHNPINMRELDAAGGVQMVGYGPGDNQLIVLFYPKAVQNKARSAAEGKPVFVQQDFVKIQHPGEKLNIVDRPATDFDKARFRQKWEAYVHGKAPQYEGIPLNLLFPHRPEIVATLEQYRVHTIEQLARLSEAGLQTVGMGAREWVNKAQEYMKQAEKGVDHHKFNAAIAEKDKEISVLKRQLDEVSARVAQMMAGQMQQPVPVQRQVRQPQMPDFSQVDPQTEIINNTMEAQTTLPPANFNNDFTAQPRRGRPKGSKNKEKI